MNDQTAKMDAGKVRPTLVGSDMIKAIARIEEYEEDVAKMEKPELIRKTRNQNGSWKGLFVCPYCGKEFEANIANVMRGRQKSCGCAKGVLAKKYRDEHGITKNKNGDIYHGESGTRLYRTYKHIVERCNNPNCREYKWYGARGIKCCFEGYTDFREYAYATGYSDDLTCERIDVNGNYEPGNITWIPLELQARNMRSNVMITYKGLTLCAAEWGEILGIRPDTLTKRKRTGWTDQKTIETRVGDSLDITLVPIEIIRAIRETRLYGCKKYPEGGADNWKRVEPQRYRDAMFRHLLRYLDDPDGVDDESGLPHLWHMVTNAAFLCEMEDKKDEHNT